MRCNFKINIIVDKISIIVWFFFGKKDLRFLRVKFINNFKCLIRMIGFFLTI